MFEFIWNSLFVSLLSCSGGTETQRGTFLLKQTVKLCRSSLDLCNSDCWCLIFLLSRHTDVSGFVFEGMRMWRLSVRWTQTPAASVSVCRRRSNVSLSSSGLEQVRRTLTGNMTHLWWRNSAVSRYIFRLHHILVDESRDSFFNSVIYSL